MACRNADVDPPSPAGVRPESGARLGLRGSLVHAVDELSLGETEHEGDVAGGNPAGGSVGSLTGGNSGWRSAAGGGEAASAISPGSLVALPTAVEQF